MVSWLWRVKETWTDMDIWWTYDSLLFRVSKAQQGGYMHKDMSVNSLNRSGSSSHLLKRMVRLEKNIQLLLRGQVVNNGPPRKGWKIGSLRDIKDWMNGPSYRLGLLGLGLDIVYGHTDDRRLCCYLLSMNERWRYR